MQKRHLTTSTQFPKFIAAEAVQSLLQIGDRFSQIRQGLAEVNGDEGEFFWASGFTLSLVILWDETRGRVE